MNITKIITELRKEEFDLSFDGNTDIPQKMRDFDFWKDCCFKFTSSKIRLLEHLYSPRPKGSVPREDLFPLLKELGYSKRRLTEVLKELVNEGFIKKQNGVVLTVDDARIIKNISAMLVFWPRVNEKGKPKGALKNRKLRYYLPYLINSTWKPLGMIVREYSAVHGPISKESVKSALDEGVNGGVFECRIGNKGKYNTFYYRLKQ